MTGLIEVVFLSIFVFGLKNILKLKFKIKGLKIK